MISIIVPVYNAEKYIKECLDSILTQTYSDFELILVNDGSKDNSAGICSEYIARDNRIHLYNKENGGPSEARNFGVGKSTGDLITFIDADDVVDTRYLETLFYVLQEKACDISVVKMALVEKSDFKRILSGKIIEYDGKAAVKDMLYQKNIDTSPCALLVKREIISSHPFPVGKYHEDDFTVYKYFLAADKVCLSENVLYFYIQRSEGIMNSVGKVSKDEIEASNNLVEVFKNIDKELYNAALSKKFSNFCQLILKSDACINDDYEIYNEIVSFVKSIKWHILFDVNCRMKNKIAAFSLIFGINGLKILDDLRKLI